MMIIKFVILSALFLTSACNERSSLKKNESKNHAVQKQVFLAPHIVRVQKGDESVLARLQLGFEGDHKIGDHIEQQKETLQNLVIQTVSEFKLGDLQTPSGKVEFQRQLLSSLNQFVDTRSFEKINIIEIEEI